MDLYIPMQPVPDTQKIKYKQDTVTGGGTGDHFFVFRIGDLRVIRAQMPASTTGTLYLTLDEIDRPERTFYIPIIEYSTYRAFCLQISPDGKVKQMGASSSGGNTYSTYGNGTYPVKSTAAT